MISYKQLLDKIDDLERRIKKLEKSQHTHPELPIVPQTKYDLGCRVCGLGSNGPMGYVCPRIDCPTAVRCTNPQDAFK